MKRWTAAFLAVMILLSGLPALSESERDDRVVEIQEGMVTREGETVGTLAENIAFLKQALHDEEIRSLFQLRDVKMITTEVILRGLAWLYRNRPVTMKILAELGVNESDCRCVGLLWDSADRLSEIGKEFSESEKGRFVKATAKKLLDDPDILEAADNFREMVTSRDIELLLNQIEAAVRDGVIAEKPEGKLTREAMNRRIDRSTFIGNLTLEILRFIDQSDWAQESVPKLLEKEELWAALGILNEANGEMGVAVMKELRGLAEDPDMHNFLVRTLDEAILLSRDLMVEKLWSGSTAEKAGPADAAGSETETTKEDNAP